MNHQNMYQHVQSPSNVVRTSPGVYGGSAMDQSMMMGLSSPMYADDNYNGGDMAGDGQAALSRKRISKACDMCRKKKIKCDGIQPTCAHCQNYKTDCVYTQVEKKRSAPKGPKYIEGLENRLVRMESCLKIIGLFSEGENGKCDLDLLEKQLAEKYGQPVPPSTPSTQRSGTPRADSAKYSRNGSQALSEDPEDGELEELSELMCSLVTNNDGNSRFFGSSSGFSIFSPKGVSWINEKTGDSSFSQMIHHTSEKQADRQANTIPNIFGQTFQRHEIIALPDRKTADGLLMIFFGGFNRMFPLFHEKTFRDLVDRYYTNGDLESSSSWACFNVVLAISYRLRVMSKLASAEDDKKAWSYLMNAYTVFIDLTMRNMDLLSVQALLGMAMFLQGTSNPQPGFFLVAAAIRVAQSIGLHKKGTGFNLPESEREQRKRVFWIACIIDQEMCLRSGRPPAQDESDMNIDLPDEHPPDGVGCIPLSGGAGQCNLFRGLAEFSLIESKVYKQLYSNKAAKKTVGELLDTIGQLDQELEDWKDSIHIDFRPEHEIKTDHPQLILNIVMTHFAYLNCSMTIHRMSIHQGYWTGKLAEFAIQGRNALALNPRVFNSAAICVNAARNIIDLLKYLPQNDCSSVWMSLYFPVAALVTLFSNILQNPHDLKARQDIAAIDAVITFLENVIADGDDNDENTSICRTLSVCAEFRRVANALLERVDKEASARRKRKTNNRDGDHVKTEPAAMTSPTISRQKSATVTDPVTGLQVTAESTVKSPSRSPAVKVASPEYTQWPMEAPMDGIAYMSADVPPPIDMSMYGNPAYFNPQPAPIFDPRMFAQPYLPSDLYQMPMTLDWDWADMTGQVPDFSGLDPNQHFPPQQQYSPQ